MKMVPRRLPPLLMPRLTPDPVGLEIKLKGGMLTVHRRLPESKKVVLAHYKIKSKNQKNQIIEFLEFLFAKNVVLKYENSNG